MARFENFPVFFFQGVFATPRRPGEVLPSSLQQDVMQVHMVVPDRLLEWIQWIRGIIAMEAMALTW